MISWTQLDRSRSFRAVRAKIGFMGEKYDFPVPYVARKGQFRSPGLVLFQSGKEETADDWIEPGGKESEAKKAAR